MHASCHCDQSIWEIRDKMYTNEQFEDNLEYDIQVGPDSIIGLKRFFADRPVYMDSRLDDFSSRSDLALNELMSVNAGTIQDGAGDYDPWLEIYNRGPGLVHIQNVFLSDDPGDPTKWSLPVIDLDDGEFLLLWLDGEPGEGSDHASFNLQPGGGELYLYKDVGTSIDSITYPVLPADGAFGRYPDGADDWGVMATPTPGATNTLHNVPPAVTGTARAPTEPGTTDPVWVTSTVTDEDGSVLSVTLSYDAGGGWVDITMYDDGAHEDGGAGDDVYGGHIPAFGQDTLVAYYITAVDNLEAEAVDPASAPSVTYTYVVGYVPPLIYINEFMADNDNVIEDPDEPDAYEDWFELYNAGADALDLGGMYLTDNLMLPTKWQVPVGVTIPAGGYLLFWADDDDEQGDVHTNFKLDADGEEIGLYDTDAYGNMAIETLTFGQQTTDVSYGRCPDGSDTWQFFAVATPETPNEPCETAIPAVSEWGMVVMTLLVLTAGTVVLDRPRRVASPCHSIRNGDGLNVCPAIAFNRALRW